jgi:hypothetical protein
MRMLVRILLQFAIVLAALAAVVAWEGNPDKWLLLHYRILVPGLLVSVLVLAPLERWLDRRGLGAFIYVDALVAGALVPWLFFPLVGNTSNFMAAAPILSAVGAVWGLVWALTRPVARLLFGPETS